MMRQFLFLILIAGRIAVGAPPVGTARSLCSAYAKLKDRANEVRETEHGAHAIVTELLAYLTDEAQAYEATGQFLPANGTGEPLITQLPDGRHVRYRSGEASDGHTRGRAEEYRTVIADLNKLRKQLAGKDGETVPSYSISNSEWSIGQLFVDPDYKRVDPARNRRETMWGIGMPLLLLAAFPVPETLRLIVRTGRVNDTINAEALAQIVGTREKHLALVKAMLGPRLNESAVREAFEAHAKFLDEQTEGLEFASRPFEYDGLLDDKELKNKMDTLAKAQLNRFDGSGANSHKRRLTPDEVKRKEEAESGIVPTGALVGSYLGALFGGTILGIMGPDILRSARDKRYGTRLPEEIRELAESAKRKGAVAPTEWIYLSSKTQDGRSVHVLLKLEDKPGNEHWRLMIIDSLNDPPEAVPTKRPPKPKLVSYARLDKLREDIVQAHFRLKFGAQLAPLDAVFVVAKHKGLDEKQFAELKRMSDGVRTMEDVARLRWLVDSY